MYCTVCGKTYEGRTDTLPTLCGNCLANGRFKIVEIPKSKESISENIRTLNVLIDRRKKELLDLQQNVKDLTEVREKLQQELSGFSANDGKEILTAWKENHDETA